GEFEGVDLDLLGTAAVDRGLFAAGAVDPDAAHGLGGGSQEKGAGFPMLGFGNGGAEAGFVGKRPGVGGLAGGFVGEFDAGEAAEFFVNEGQKFVWSGGVASLGAFEDLGEVAHSGADFSPKWRERAS